MPLRLEIKKKLNTRTERVKSVDFHPSVPWVLSALYSGHLMIHNWEEQASVRTIEVCPSTAIRCAKFVARKQWVICGSDDMFIRVFNYHSMEKVKQFDAHADFIRHIAVHPTLPLVLSASDDMTVRLWDWSKDWARIATFESHLHYVMMAQWNPKDPHIFATASLDRSIKVWGTQSPGIISGGVVTQPHFNLLGHESGVNCIEYSPNGEKPYIVSGGDDNTVRVWDYQTKQCVQILTGHSGPLLSAAFHPHLPIIISGSEDGVVNIWHATTYRQETSLKYSMGRIWGVASDPSSNAVALATDEGTIVIKIGTEKAVASMQGGKIVMAKGSEIQTVNVKLVDDTLFSDGEKLPLPLKDLGACEIFPQSLTHHPNGRLIAICGDGEYVVYTAQALRNKAYGKAVDFVWSNEGHYAVRDESGQITIFHNFKEHVNFKPEYMVEEMFGGRLLGVRSSEFICFYDWQDFRLIRRIDVHPNGVHWNEDGSEVVLACQDSFFILRYDNDAVTGATANDSADAEDGIEIAFELQREVNEKIESGCWFSGCFAFTTARLRLQTITAGVVDTVAFLDRPAWLLGYLSDTNRLYLVDRELSVISYKLHLSLVEYQTAISRKDFESADDIFKRIPITLHNKVARFLESQGFRQKALEVTKDLDHKFELGRSLGQLELCAKVIHEAQSASPATAAIYKDQWKQLGDLGLEQGSISLALACFHEADDLSGLFLIYSSIGDAKGMRSVADRAAELGKTNIAVMSYLLLQDVDQCVEVLLNVDRIPEAAAFAKSYAPSRISETVRLWKLKLTEAKHESIAETLADPDEHPDLFPNFPEALKAEKEFRKGAMGFQPVDNPVQISSLPPVTTMTEEMIMDSTVVQNGNLLTPERPDLLESSNTTPTFSDEPLSQPPREQNNANKNDETSSLSQNENDDLDLDGSDEESTIKYDNLAKKADNYVELEEDPSSGDSDNLVSFDSE